MCFTTSTMRRQSWMKRRARRRRGWSRLFRAWHCTSRRMEGRSEPRLSRPIARWRRLQLAADLWAGDAHAVSDSLVLLLQLHGLSDDFAARRAVAHLGGPGEFQ